MRYFLLLILFPVLVSAELVVSDGYLVVAGGTVRETSETEILNATMILEDGSELITDDMSIQSQGEMRGCGKLTTSGILVNEGLILADCGFGFTLNFTGDVQNATGGVIRARNNTAVVFASTVINQGILDLIFSPSEPPVGLTGTGTAVTESTLPPMTIDAGAGMLFVPAFAGHNYQVQYAIDLSANPVSWSDAGLSFSVPIAETKPVPFTNTVESSQVYRYLIQ